MGLPAQAVTQSCISTGQGALCADIVNGHDYRATYTKTGGSGEYVDFNLYCSDGTWYGDQGAFWIYINGSRSYIFGVGNHGSCYVTMWNRAGSGSWSTNPVTP
jgi:hypothetical protein